MLEGLAERCALSELRESSSSSGTAGEPVPPESAAFESPLLGAVGVRPPHAARLRLRTPTDRKANPTRFISNLLVGGVCDRRSCRADRAATFPAHRQHCTTLPPPHLRNRCAELADATR